jgi:hypothetical protein
LPGQLVGAPGAVQPPGVEVGAEVGELRGGVGEQVEDDDQDRSLRGLSGTMTAGRCGSQVPGLEPPSKETLAVSMYVLLADPLSPAQGAAVTEAVAGTEGRVTVLISSRLMVVDGGAATNAGLQGLVGDAVVAVGDDDVAPLLAAAVGFPDLLAQVGVLALTTSPALAAAEAVRPRQGEAWHGLGCIPEEA